MILSMNHNTSQEQSISYESISFTSNLCEAGSEIVEETGEANGTHVPSQEPKQNASSKSKNTKHYEAKKTFRERLVERFTWQKSQAPRRRRRSFFTDRGHKTAMLFMSVSPSRVWGESFTGKLPNNRASSEGSSGQPS